MKFCLENIPLLLCLTCAALVHGAEYHVSSSATKEGAGTVSAPFRTIGAAVRVLQPRDTLWNHAGVYRETMKGITDNVVGKAPDCGAYEFGGPKWTAGVNGMTGNETDK